LDLVHRKLDVVHRNSDRGTAHAPIAQKQYKT
jgi:hypothetical protein